MADGTQNQGWRMLQILGAPLIGPGYQGRMAEFSLHFSNSNQIQV